MKTICDKCSSKVNLQYYGGGKQLALCLKHDRKWMKVMDRTKFNGSRWQKEYERQYWEFCGKPLVKIERPITSIKKILVGMPFSSNYKANRYDTDDEIVLSIWGGGDDKTFDIRIPK